MKLIQTMILMMMFLTLFGCQGKGQIVKPGEPINPVMIKQTAQLGEPFTLKLNESAKIDGAAGIEITVNRIGRKWSANGGGESLDFVFSIKHGEKTENYSNPVPPLVTVGEYKIEVIKTEPFGYGYATFIVTINDSGTKTDSNEIAAAKFAEHFGWHIDESISPAKIT
jgi:hypothetical protein